MKKWQYSLAVALWLSVAPAIAHGESYPNRPVTLVVTAAPGGVTDILARILGQRLGKIWGQQVVVENKPGASNQIGAVSVANSVPDGYTMLVTAEATFVINPLNNWRPAAEESRRPGRCALAYFRSDQERRSNDDIEQRHP
jgi:tripartite-type tricarboxylate transporter receptor subunit TctC